MKVLVTIDDKLPKETQVIIRTSLSSMSGVNASSVLPDLSNDSYLNNEDIRNELVEEFFEIVEGREREIDPAQTTDWRTLAIGFGLTKGLSSECSWMFANLAIYHSGKEFPKPLLFLEPELVFHPDGKCVMIRDQSGESNWYELRDWYDINTINPKPVPEPIMPPNLVFGESELDKIQEEQEKEHWWFRFFAWCEKIGR